MTEGVDVILGALEAVDRRIQDAAPDEDGVDLFTASDDAGRRDYAEHIASALTAAGWRLTNTPADEEGDAAYRHQYPGEEEVALARASGGSLGRGVPLSEIAVDAVQPERWREALTEWQDLAAAYSAMLIEAGHHPQGIHESPSSYDGNSSLACTAPSCRALLAGQQGEER